MELYNAVVILVRDYLAEGIFISVLVIILCRALFKNRFDTEYPLVIISWIMIFYAGLLLLHHLLVIAFADGSASFLAQATGSYSYIFWLTMLTTVLLPFLLLFKKFQSRPWLIFTIALLMNGDWLMDSLVIHIMSIHRDYTGGNAYYLPYANEIKIVLIGSVEGVVIMIVGNLFNLRNKEQQA